MKRMVGFRQMATFRQPVRADWRRLSESGVDDSVASNGAARDPDDRLALLTGENQLLERLATGRRIGIDP